ncbi:MAG: SSS family transporter [Roseivirga sp.]|jgi:SSS family transporter
MSPTLVIGIIGGYFLLLIVIARITSRGADSTTFFTANKQSPWYLVAFGMIGASLSGVTFISVPGEVGNSFFSYFQVVLGYLVGYFVIATVLLPLYYRLNLVSIYGYLEQRFGFWSYKTGSFFFLLSRTIGAAFRLFLVAGVLQIAIFDSLGVPFWVSVLITILLIWVYTFQGGIKTIVWTDALQTFFMLLAVIITIYIITKEMGIGIGEAFSQITESDYSKTFFFDWNDKKDFFKQFISGAFIAIVMTGLDQDMMQKNLTCKTLKDAQKNVFWFSVVLVIANLLFLSLGALLYLYAGQNGIEIPARTDGLYPLIALNHLSTFAGVVFLLGIVAAAYSSADSALTALTTSFCMDFLNFDKKEESLKKPIRLKVHIAFSLLLFFVIIIFNAINDSSVINSIFKVAGYTYGPLLGLFSFGMITKLKVKDPLVLPVCLAAPILSYIVDINSVAWFNGFEFGFFILIFNGALTFLGMLLISKRDGVIRA